MEVGGIWAERVPEGEPAGGAEGKPRSVVEDALRCHSIAPKPQSLGTARPLKSLPGPWARVAAVSPEPQVPAAAVWPRGKPRGPRVRQTRVHILPFCAVTWAVPLVDAAEERASGC